MVFTKAPLFAEDIQKSMIEEDQLKAIDEGYTYEYIQKIVDYLESRTSYKPKVGIICGSGLGGLADLLERPEFFPYETIPNFPVSTVPGHIGRLVFGKLNGVDIICMQGRFHCYEGYSLWKCAMPVRVMKILGVKKLIVTNAAGGLNPSYNVGDIMIIKDHVNLQGFAGDSPLKGNNDERFGPRFPAMNNCYDQNLRQIAKQVASDMGLEPAIKEGVYIMVGGPCYETVAELRMLKVIGVDAVGMSTVPEVVIARHCGIDVFAFSLITNKCITEYDTDAKANHEEVMDTANSRKTQLQELIRNLIQRIAES